MSDFYKDNTYLDIFTILRGNLSDIFTLSKGNISDFYRIQPDSRDEQSHNSDTDILIYFEPNLETYDNYIAVCDI